MLPSIQTFQHPLCTRRTALQAGAVGLLGLGMNHVAALRTMAAATDRFAPARRTASSTSFCRAVCPSSTASIPSPMRPPTFAANSARSPHERRGCASASISPRSPPRSHLLVAGPLADATRPTITRPAITSCSPADRDCRRLRSQQAAAGRLAVDRRRRRRRPTPPRNNLPPAVVLPERLVHNTGRVIPGQFAGIMGPQHDPWFIEASPFDPRPTGPIPNTSSTTSSGPCPPQVDGLPGPEPDARRRARPAASASRMDLLGTSTGSVPTSTGRPVGAVRPPSPGGRLAADRHRGSAGRSTSTAADPRPSIAMAATPSAGRC